MIDNKVVIRSGQVVTLRESTRIKGGAGSNWTSRSMTVTVSGSDKHSRVSAVNQKLRGGSPKVHDTSR